MNAVTIDTLSSLFSHVCGQQHCWVIGGQVLPLCQRCTGLYVGGAFAACWLLYVRPRPTNAVLWIHGLMMLIMIPFGYHMIAHGASMRSATGLLFGFGLTYYLALNPGLHFGFFERHRACWIYWTALLVFIPILMLAVHSSSHVIAGVIAISATVGLVLYAVLIVVNAIVLPLAAWDLARDRLFGRAR